MKKNRTVLFSVILLVLMLVICAVAAGCGSGSDETTTTAAADTTTTAGSTDTTIAAETTAGSTDSTTAGTFDGEVVIGVLGSMTGSSAMNGAEQMWAQQKAADDINAKGGIDVAGKKMKMTLKFIDDKSDATEGAAAVEKLIKVEGIKLILSTQVTPVNLAAAIVAEKYQALYQQVITWTQIARENNWKWCPDLFFSSEAVAEVPFATADKMGANAPTKWGVLTEDNADGQALGDGVKAVAKKHNATIAEYQTYTPGTKDYASVILKFKQANVDGLVVLISASDGITFVKQMKEQGFSPKYMMGWKGFWPVQFMQGLGADSDYICHDGFWSEDLGYPYDKELGAAYTAENDGQQSVSVGLPYAQVQILAMAIEAAGSTDPAAVRDQIYGHTFKGTTMGDVTYDAGGVADITPIGLQWVGQKRVLIYPDHVDQLQLFKAWDQR